MTEQNKIPQIRFKGFSGEWGAEKLGNLCLIGDIDHKMPQSVIDGIPYLMTGDFVGTNGLDFENSKLISTEDYEQLSKKIKPEAGDILFARYASVGAVRYVETQIKFLVSYSCAILKHNDTANGKYLFYYLQANEVQRQIELEINTGSQRNIGIDSLKKLIIILPKKREQVEIANFLTNLDTLITLHQRKYDKLLNVKKAMLEKMFPKNGADVPEIRFKGFSDKWEERKLGELCTLITKGTTPLNKSGGGSINFIKIENINNLSGKITITTKIAKEEHENYLKRSQLKEDDILFSIAGTLGRVTIINKDILPANTNQALAIIRLKQEHLDYITTSTFWLNVF